MPMHLCVTAAELCCKSRWTRVKPVRRAGFYFKQNNNIPGVLQNAITARHSESVRTLAWESAIFLGETDCHTRFAGSQ
jgi:hypothetical protein